MSELLQQTFHEDETFSDINIENRILNNYEFYSCSFNNCNFSYIDFTSTTFDDCEFVNCSLIVTKMLNCSFRYVLFKQSKLQGINFETLNQFALEVHFSKSKLELCTFIKMQLSNTLFNNSLLYECDFIDNNLSGANCKKCDFAKTVFQGNNCFKADFSNAKNYNIDPTKNNLTSAKFSLPEAISLLNHFAIKIN